MKKHKLRTFYLWTWSILSVILIFLYLDAGAQGFVFGNIFLEIIFAGIGASIPTLIYFFFIHKQ